VKDVPSEGPRLKDQGAKSILSFRGSALPFDDKAGRDLKHFRIGFRAREINHMNRLRAFPWILASDGQIHLKVGGIPELSRANQRLAVPQHASVNGKGLASADHVKTIDNVGPQALAGKVAFPVVE
jgi:hypothetical protein